MLLITTTTTTTTTIIIITATTTTTTTIIIIENMQLKTIFVVGNDLSHLAEALSTRQSNL